MIDFTIRSGDYRKLIFPVIDANGDPFPIPLTNHVVPRPEAVWRFGETEMSDSLLEKIPVVVGETSLVVEILSGELEVPPGLYHHQMELTVNDNPSIIRSGIVRVTARIGD